MESHVVEYEIRGATYKKVIEGEDLADALRTSWVDPIVTESLDCASCWGATEAAKRKPGSQREDPANTPRTGSYDIGKGKGRGKMTESKGKGKESRVEGCAEFNVEGKRICFAFNNPNQKCTMGKKCRFLHVCGRCKVAKLPMYECTCPPTAPSAH